ncbi:hypothetical protein RRG08_044851 [Elysia crispata]|uniref:Uncharacterized protein n=1 Tax=Elysia crispata TaxID=231223 RepID=A0AAE1A533_9GAST|nr:hypothetical protein RRG08_044851 [Elysia crispata]
MGRRLGSGETGWDYMSLAYIVIRKAEWQGYRTVRSCFPVRSPARANQSDLNIEKGSNISITTADAGLCPRIYQYEFDEAKINHRLKRWEKEFEQSLKLTPLRACSVSLDQGCLTRVNTRAFRSAPPRSLHPPGDDRASSRIFYSWRTTELVLNSEVELVDQRRYIMCFNSPFESAVYSSKLLHTAKIFK